MSALWISALAETAVRSAALLGIAALLTLVLRRRAAATRHLVWGCALADVLVLPLAGTVLPGLPVPLPSALAGALPASLVATTADAPGPENAPPVTSDAEARSGSGFGTAPGTANDASEAARAGGSRSSTGSTGSSVAAVGATIAWAPVLLAVWAVGAAVIAAWVLAGVRNTRQLAAEASEVASPEWLDPARDIAAQLGIRRPVRVLQSERAVTPITWGWRRPVVVVPAAATGWSPERLAVVLRHELAHVSRGDVVTQLLARWACALYWFNPAVWFSAYRLRVERERACDDEVLRLGTRASDYANHLLDIARECQPPGLRASAAVAMARRSQLECRMRAILDPQARRTAGRATAFLATAVLSAATLAASATTPVAQTRRATAAPDAAGEQEPRTATDVAVAVPLPAPAPKPEARPPVQRPRAATRIRKTEPTGRIASIQSARQPEKQRADELGEEPEASRFVIRRLEVVNPRLTGSVSGDRITATLGPPVAAIGAVSADTISADGGQEAEAPDVAVEEQSLTLEKLHGEFAELHEEARRLDAEMRRRAARVLARDLEEMRRQVEATRRRLGGAWKDDAEETTEPRQRSEPAATRSGAAAAITETEPASRAATAQSERWPDPVVSVSALSAGTISSDGGQEAEAPDGAVEEQSRTLEELYEELDRFHDLAAEAIRGRAERMQVQAEQMQREAERMRRAAEELRRQAERGLARDLEQVRRELEALRERVRQQVGDADPDDFDIDVYRVAPARTPQAPEPPDQPEATSPPASTSPDHAGPPETTDPPETPPPPPQAFPPTPPAPPPAPPGEVPPAG